MNTNVITIHRDAILSEALSLMSEHDIDELPVIEKNRLIGMLTYQDIAKRRNVPFTTKVENLIRFPPRITPEQNLIEICDTLLSAGYHGVPITQNANLQGLISRTEIIRALTEVEEVTQLNVSEIMTPTPMCISENDSILLAKNLIETLEELSVPVVNNNQYVTGIIGLKEITDVFLKRSVKGKQDWARTKAPVELSVKSIMNPNPRLFNSSDILESILKAMVKEKLNTAIITEPVYEKNSTIIIGHRPVGIITVGDIIEFVAKMKTRKEIYIQITGLDEKEPNIYEGLYKLVERNLSRIAKMVNIKMLNIHITQHATTGGLTKYSIHVRLSTDKKLFYARTYEWDIFKAFDNALMELTIQIRKFKDIRVTRRKLDRKVKKELGRFYE